jgi:hypothetical protein
LAADLLAGNEAQTADNAKISDGQLRAWYQDLSQQLLTNTGTVRTIYLYEDQYWLEWDADVDVVLGPIASDTTSRIYYTGDGIPKKSNLSLATTGTGEKPVTFYPLAVPSPKPAPTEALGAGGSGDPRNITYVWTIVSSWGEESIPSPASDVAAAKDGQTVNLSAMTMVWQASTSYALGESVYAVGDEGGTYLYKCVAAGVSGAYEPGWNQVQDGDTLDNAVTWRCFENNLTSKYIYRFNTGNQYGAYQYVASIAVSATTYADSILDANLGAVLGSTDYDPPPDGLTGLTYLSNGIMLAFLGKDLYVSEAYRPWAWPIAYILSLDFAIKSIVSTGSTAVVTTEGNPYTVSGVSPSSITTSKISQTVACVSKRSSRGYANSGIYACPNGLAMVNQEGVTIITQKHYSVDEWALLYPTTMHGYIHDNQYFAFYSYLGTEGGFVFDLLTGDLTELDFYADACFVDPQTDKLYYMRQWDEVLLQEDGIAYPSRTNALLLEGGDNILLE